MTGRRPSRWCGVRFSAAILAAFAFATPAWAQSLIQSGPFQLRHMPMYNGAGSTVPLMIDSGQASGFSVVGTTVGAGLSELLQVNGTTPGTGPLGAHDCHYSAPVTPGPYSYLCLDANIAGSPAIIVGASTTPVPNFGFYVNGTFFPFPGPGGGNVIGPTSPTPTVGDVASWNGSLSLVDSHILASSLVTTTASSPVVGDVVTWNGGQTLTDSHILGTALAINAVHPITTLPYTVQTTDCNVALAASGSVFGTISIPAATGFPAVCRLTIDNNDPWPGGRARFISFAVSSNPSGNFMLYPGQSLTLANDGSTWQVKNAPGRWNPTTSLTLYVDSGGNDGNDCLAPGTASACLTILHAWITGRDFTSVKQFGIQLGLGQTFTSAGEMDGDFFGQGQRLVSITGDPTLANPPIISAGPSVSGIAMTLRDGAWVIFNGVHFQALAAGQVGVSVQQKGLADFSNILWDEFPTGAAIAATDTADVNLTATQKLNANTVSAGSWAFVTQGAKLVIGSISFDCQSTAVAMANGFIQEDSQARIVNQGISFANCGSVTGKQYAVTNLSLLSKGGVTFPGSISGTCDATSDCF